ncbi:MAG: Gfo/Idh/MocA family protein, partial [Bacteroidota bacterium]
MNQPIKFAVVGAGHIGKRHAEMIARESEAQLTAFCDVRSPEDCQTLEYRVPHFESIDDLLNSGLECDVVTICTPNGLHAEQAIQALKAGKHVVVEKPMGLTKESCERVIYTALQMNRQVFCVMQNRYSPPSEWIKEIVSKGLLGDIFMVQV